MQKFFLFFFIFNSLLTLGQDRIVRDNGEIVKCKITSIDSNKIVFNVKRKGYLVSTTLSRDKISSYSSKYQNRINYLLMMDPLWQFKDSLAATEISKRRQGEDRIAFISGQLGYSSYKLSADNIDREKELVVQPQFGFALGDKFDFGFNLRLIRNKIEYEQHSSNDREDFDISLTWMVGHFARFYFSESRFRFYNELDVNVGMASLDDETDIEYDKIILFWTNLNAGFTYRFHDLLELDLKVGLIEYISSFEDNPDKSKDIGTGLSMSFRSTSIGLRWYF